MLGALRRARSDPDRVLVEPLAQRALVAPVVGVRIPGVALGADDVAVRGRELPVRRPLLPRRRNGGDAVLLHERGVVPEDVHREVVAKAVDLAVDRAEPARAVGETVENAARHEAVVQDGSVVEGRLGSEAASLFCSLK